MPKKPRLDRVVQAKVDRATMRKLVDAARREDVSVSTFTRRLIEQHVNPDRSPRASLVSVPVASNERSAA